MNRDDIIRMAEEAGFIYSVLNEGGAREYMGDCFERFAALVAAAEREACARVCEEVDRRWVNQAEKCAERIRARGEE